MMVRLTLKGEAVAAEERMLKGLNERIRDVRQGPDGLIYFITDSPKGRLLRLVRADLQLRRGLIFQLRRGLIFSSPGLIFSSVAG